MISKTNKKEQRHNTSVRFPIRKRSHLIHVHTKNDTTVQTELDFRSLVSFPTHNVKQTSRERTKFASWWDGTNSPVDFMNPSTSQSRKTLLEYDQTLPILWTTCQILRYLLPEKTSVISTPWSADLIHGSLSRVRLHEFLLIHRHR